MRGAGGNTYIVDRAMTKQFRKKQIAGSLESAICGTDVRGKEVTYTPDWKMKKGTGTNQGSCIVAVFVSPSIHQTVVSVTYLQAVVLCTSSPVVHTLFPSSQASSFLSFPPPPPYPIMTIRTRPPYLRPPFRVAQELSPHSRSPRRTQSAPWPRPHLSSPPSFS